MCARFPAVLAIVGVDIPRLRSVVSDLHASGLSEDPMTSLPQSVDSEPATNSTNQQPATSVPANPSQPIVDYKQEVRFAVVMYGGVSLAIYINGIAQELFRMVKSTAPQEAGATRAVAGSDLSSTERIYRKLSYLLANRPFREECRTNAAANRKLPDAPTNDAIEARFVVDILSGTSAGGINAIFLAKALANNQSIDQLKELWVNEGDIGLLINDKRSVEGLGLKNQKPPLSLLNSRRMYLKLLHALEDMERSKRSEPKTKSRFLDQAELDLFITTTDIQGLAMPIRLSDCVVFERRHRNVFHLKYRSEEAADEQRNDFIGANNPFLAFAARCTSSFPFAFEPMKLSDIDEILERFPEYRGNKNARADSPEWLSFFDRDVVSTASCLADRPFGDGGYLDNKPFSFAADTIARRQPNLPVDRKLIYIEPSPEHPELENLELNEVDALQNVKAAILDLPTYETIREDLERVLVRNSLINRVNQITDAIDQDLENSRLRRPNLRTNEWKELDLAGMVQRFGIYYLPYRRLRIASASDELARTVARILGFNEDSAIYLAIRALVHAWRESVYKDRNAKKDDDPLVALAKQVTEATTKEGGTPKQQAQVEGILRSWVQIHFSDAYKKSELERGNSDESQSPPDENVKTANQFLLDYDYKYWLRRLTFVRSKVDQLLQLDKVPVKEGELDVTDRQQIVLDRLNRYISPTKYQHLSPDEKEQIKAVLTFLRCELCELHRMLRREGRKVQSSQKKPKGEVEVNENQVSETTTTDVQGNGNKPKLGADEGFAAQLLQIELQPKLVNYLLGTVDEWGKDQPFSKLRPDDATQRAKRLFEPNSEIAQRFGAQDLSVQFKSAAETLRRAVDRIITPVWERCELLLHTENGFEILKQEHQKDPEKVRCAVPDRLGPHTKSLRSYLWHYLSKFDDYDQVRFPIMYGTDVGESDVVDVFRISPEDAPSLIDEREESKKPNGRQKLAGTTLHHFGAFLDRVWRQNDIMWGRLDGAERLITALLPYPSDAAVRDALIKEAHAVILREELSTESRTQLSMLMSEALIRASSGEPIELAIQKVTNELTESPLRTRLASVMTAIFDDDLVKTDDDKLVKFVKLGYRVNRRLDPTAVLQTISRSTQTIGGIFEDLANKNGLDGRSLSWIARLGQFFWGLVQVAVPNSILNKLVTHWLYVLYLFEVFLIVGGLLLSRPNVQNFGWTAFGITAVLNVAKLLLTDLMRGRHVVKRLGIVILVSLLSLFLLIGFFKVVGSFGVRVGTPELTPLSWLSTNVSTILQKTGVESFLGPVLLLSFVAITLVMLNAAEVVDFSRFRRRSVNRIDDFKPIRLRGFRKRDMKDVQLCPDSEGLKYIIPARLSAEPPIAWVSIFNEDWNTGEPNVRVKIHRDRIRFSSDLQNISSIWDRLSNVVDSTNENYSEELKKQQAEVDRLEREERSRRDEEFENKWDSLKELN